MGTVAPQGVLPQAVAFVKAKNTGTGFFIGKNGLLLTCFHVVRDRNTATLHNSPIKVIYNQTEYEAQCVYQSPNPQVIDFAILELGIGKLPEDAVLLPIGKYNINTRDKAFSSFGYRHQKQFTGLHARGEILGYSATHLTNSQHQQIEFLQLQSSATGAQSMQPGMSGAPVYHEATGQIVGMVSDIYSNTNKDEVFAIAVPLEMLALFIPIKKRLIEEELLQILGDILMPSLWFTERSFRAFYECLPFPGLQKYDDCEEQKHLSLLAQLRGEDRIYDLIRFLQMKRPDVSLQKLLPHLPPVMRVDFVNREVEREEACGIYAPPYILFDAPIGYGKRELLKAIEQQHFRDGWLSIYAEVNETHCSAFEIAKVIAQAVGTAKDLSRLRTPRDVGVWLAGWLEQRFEMREAKGVLLLVSGMENLPVNEIGLFLDDYVGATWKEEAEKHLPFKIISLTPFKFEFVRETVRILFPSCELDLCAAHLMHITGGHPGCMTQILESMGRPTAVEAHFQVHKSEYEEIVLSMANRIRSGIPSDLQDTFDALSVFYRYDQDMLDIMLSRGLIPQHSSAAFLERKLLATCLVRRSKDHQFLQDDIVRRLLAIRLRLESPDRFLAYCQQARNILLEYMNTTTNRVEYLALELLYQDLQLRYYQGAQDIKARQNLCQDFFGSEGIASQILATLSSFSRWSRIQATFHDLLQDPDEWEFRFALNFFLRGNNYDEGPFQLLKEKFSPRVQ